jgi:sortase A
LPVLLIAGLGGVGYYGYTLANQDVYQAYENWSFDQQIAGRSHVDFSDYLRERTPFGFLVGDANATGKPDIASPPPLSSPHPAEGDLLGRVEIPRLNLSAIVREGVDKKTLSIAVGHIPSTALPGQPGNFAIAAHRDTLFRALKDIRRDDVVTFQSSNGTFSYRVEATKIVKPSDVSVISPDGGGLVSRVISRNSADMAKLLTMITCYPFYYVGSAPKRFIVQARLIPEDGKTVNAAETVVSVPVPMQPSIAPRISSMHMAAEVHAASPISTEQSAHFSGWRQSPAKPRKRPGLWRQLFHAP